MTVERSEVVAARGVGIGIGLIVLMLVWLIGSRLAGLVWDRPVGPTVAFVTAIVVGAGTAVVSARRLAARVRRGG
jgi:hypothetical protein